MERVLRGDEKIRKAEEIYYKRKMGLPSTSSNYGEEKKSYLWCKILLELLLILNLSLVIVGFQNKDFIFTQEFLKMISDYNVNLTKVVQSFIQEESTQEVLNNEVIDTNIVNPEQQVVEPTAPVLESGVVPNTEQTSSVSQMELDIEEIKKSYSFEKPIDGTVTSLFGARESVYQNVSGYHTGLDIGAKKGTSIKAAHSGTVALVSSKGDYGKHLKIEDGNLQTIYAHCSKILVKEGDYINIGQEIARVGSTGNSTGPHLHFEIRYFDRLVDPMQLVKF